MEMRGVCKRFGATVALNNVGFKVAPGEVHALVGENGAGKSTLMKVLAGAVKPDAGVMWLDGEEFMPDTPLKARQQGVAMIYQELSLAGHLSVEENIMLGLEPNTLGFIHGRQVRRRALEAIGHFGHPEIRPEVQVQKLSVAAQQLVEIARALAVGCRVLVLDEPTSSLAGQDVEQLFEQIDRLKKKGLAIVYISHILEEVQQVADKVTVLRDGESVGESSIEDITTDEIIALMVGRKVEDLYPRSKRVAGEFVVQINKLQGVEKPESATLSLRRGEVLGIAGLMGAGRTELLRCLFGLDEVKNGDITVGVYAGPAAPKQRWNQGVGMLSEDRKEEGLALTLSIADNTTLSRLKGFGPLGMVLPVRQEKAARKWIERLGIRCKGPKQAVGELSGGNQQKVALARLLQHDVDVLLLDEPTRGIDVAAKALIYQLIDQLASGSAESKPKAVIMVSSYLPELMGICDRIAVMCRGRLGEAHQVKDINEHQLMVEATGQEIAS